jgi:hypothetical protein
MMTGANLEISRRPRQIEPMELAYKILTVEEFLDSCPNDQRHYQLFDGVIVGRRIRSLRRGSAEKSTRLSAQRDRTAFCALRRGSPHKGCVAAITSRRI